MDDELIHLAIRQAFPQTTGELPITFAAQRDDGFHCLCIGDDMTTAIPVLPHKRRPADDYERVTRGVNPHLFVLRGGHPNALYYALFCLLVEVYRAHPIDESDGIHSWKIWANEANLFVEVTSLDDRWPLPPALRGRLVVVGTDAGLWYSRALQWGYPESVQGLLATTLETITNVEIDQPPPPVVVPCQFVQGYQAVLL